MSLRVSDWLLYPRIIRWAVSGLNVFRGSDGNPQVKTMIRPKLATFRVSETENPWEPISKTKTTGPEIRGYPIQTHPAVILRPNKKKQERPYTINQI
jgi:hypothetical protein